MQITVYSFSKRKNSTKQPTGGTVIKNVRLKDDTSIANPTFILTRLENSFNYLLWNGRYYFVTDIVMRNNNIYEVSATTDVLATYKSNIGNYTAFVERAASSYDVDINDNLLSVKQTNTHVDIHKYVTEFNTYGCFVVRVIGYNNSTAPQAGTGTLSDTGIATYAVSIRQLKYLLDYAFNGILADIQNEAVKAIFNPFEYIVSCKWFPLTQTQLAGSNPTTQRIYLGQYDTGVECPQIIQSGFVENSGNITIPRYYNDFRDFNGQYTQAKIMVPGVGLVDCDPVYFNNYLKYSYLIDTITGEATFILTTITSQEISSPFMCLSGKLGIDVQLSQISVNAANIMSDIIGATSNIFAGNYAAAAAEGADIATSITQPTTNMLPSHGSLAFLQTYHDVWFFLYRRGTKDFQTNTAGRPLYENKKLSTLSGYIKCSNASVPIAALASDRDAVNNYLNTGFYYE